MENRGRLKDRPLFFLYKLKGYDRIATMERGKTRGNNTIIHRLGSLKLAFFLMLLLALFIGQRALIAQKQVLSQDGEGVPWWLGALNSFGLDSTESLEKPFFVLLLFVVVNLGFSSLLMARRVMSKQRSFRRFRAVDEIRSLSCNTEFRLPKNSKNLVTQSLKEKGFQVISEQDGPETRLFAGKRDAGRWGVLFFHLTFFIVLVGGLASYMSRYSGYLELSPGDVFVEARENYLRRSDAPLLFKGDKKFKIELKAIDLSYWKPGVVKQRAGVVHLYDSRGNDLGQKRIQVNSPLKIEGMTIYQGNRHGYLAGLEAIDSEGTRVQGEARFGIPEKPGEKMTSRVTLPGTGLDLDLELFTEKLGDIEGLEQFKTKYMATLMKVTSQEGPHRTFRGVLFGGASLSFEGLTLRFVTLKPYTSFLAVRDYGVPIIFSGFVFLMIGLVVIYFWVPENYWAVVEKKDGGDLVVIGAATEKYQASLRERFDFQIAQLEAGAFS